MNQKVIEVKKIRKDYMIYKKPIDRFKESMSIGRKSYHDTFSALDEVNIDIYKGECVGIIGTNGSGKSTLLKIITGVLNPTSGELDIKGKISALLELGTGFNPDYTGVENIYLNGTMMGYSKEDIDKKIDDIENFAEIGDFINQPVKTYSSGMFARLAFAVAINVDPDILIVDEALSVGDIFFQSKCYRKFNEFKEKGKTIIFVSHDLGSVLKYCDRCLLLHKGKQIAMGDTKSVVDTYRKILVNHFEDDEGTGNEETLSSDNNKNVQPKIESIIWKDNVMLNPNYNEYGAKEGEMLDFGIFDENGMLTNAIYKNTEFTVRIRYKINKDLNNPIFAYTIKDLKGTDITGTNTMLEDSTYEELKAGQTGVVAFKQVMTLQGGQYLVSFGCTGYELDEFKVYHRLYDIYQLQVLSDRNTIGFVDLNADVFYEE